jgi:hypothetical protein
MNRVVVLALLLSLAAAPAAATTMQGPMICRPARVRDTCERAVAHYAVSRSDDGHMRRATLVSIVPDGVARPWAECVAANWTRLRALNRVPSAPGPIVEIRFEVGDCRRESPAWRELARLVRAAARALGRD